MKPIVHTTIEYLDLSSAVCQELEDKARAKLASIYKNSRIIKDEVFNILADVSVFMQYPIQDDEICAFICRKHNRVFSFVNSYLPYEKQIFAAAHELYHIWFDQEILSDGELLQSEVIDRALESGPMSEREARANRFAAIFLVPKDVLRAELDYLSVSSGAEPTLAHAVRLMDTFGVPYKTMVRRLYETGYLGSERCMLWLQMPDRGEKSPILQLQKRLQIGEELNQRNRVIRFDGLVDNALSAYEQGSISGERLKYLLSLARKDPQDFDINMNTILPTEEELMRIMENE